MDRGAWWATVDTLRVDTTEHRSMSKWEKWQALWREEMMGCGPGTGVGTGSGLESSGWVWSMF